MEQQEMVDLCKQYSLYTWSATGKVNPMPIERAEGIFLYAPDGKRYYDFNSLTYGVAQSLALAEYLGHIITEGEQPGHRSLSTPSSCALNSCTCC